jgi:hypothetical protein
MSEALASKERLIVADAQYRRSMRMVVLMGALAAFSVLSHFVPFLGAETGIFPWWMTIVTVLLFGFTLMLARSFKSRREEADAAFKAAERGGGEPAPSDDVTQG